MSFKLFDLYKRKFPEHEVLTSATMYFENLNTLKMQAFQQGYPNGFAAYKEAYDTIKQAIALLPARLINERLGFRRELNTLIGNLEPRGDDILSVVAQQRYTETKVSDEFLKQRFKEACIAKNALDGTSAPASIK